MLASFSLNGSELTWIVETVEKQRRKLGEEEQAAVLLMDYVEEGLLYHYLQKDFSCSCFFVFLMEQEKSSTAVRVGSTEELRRIFKEFDRDGDGKISCGEVKHSLGVMGTPMTAEEAEVVVKDFDKDGDGYIDFDEFVDFIQRGGGEEDAGKELKDAFDLYDMDKNGLISATELHAALKKLGMKSTVAEG